MHTLHYLDVSEHSDANIFAPKLFHRIGSFHHIAQLIVIGTSLRIGIFSYQAYSPIFLYIYATPLGRGRD